MKLSFIPFLLFLDGVNLQVSQSPHDLVLSPGSPMKVTCSVAVTSDPYMYWYRWTLTDGLAHMFTSVGSGIVDPVSVDGFSASRPNSSHFVLESQSVAPSTPAVLYCSWSIHS
uniref:Ig-like domain-containing protein n=1 Tax=Scleropages formosus TaxID=113540 RepID=A0A8C9R7B6_SCLFO